jgi:hypothetical protein
MKRMQMIPKGGSNLCGALVRRELELRKGEER